MSTNPRDYQRDYMRQWKRDRRAKYMGGKSCCWCGATEDLQIHHVNPEEKEGHNIWTWSEERIQREMDKCIIVCRYCHTAYHVELRRAKRAEDQAAEKGILYNLAMAFGKGKRR